MTQIALLHEGYNWDSYSIVRSMHDILKEREDVEYLTSHNADDIQSGGYLWLYSSQLGLTAENYQEIKERGLTVVNFGLSDPNMFQENRLKVCDVYCTNDLNTYRKYSQHNPFNCKVHHWQPGCYLEKFTKRDVGKDIDVLFVGTLSHGYIPLRKQYIMRLRKEDINFKGYGDGFDRYLAGEDLVNTYSRAHLNIDVVTKISSLSNSRLLQSAACGTPTLILKREDVLEEFQDGKEILTYGGGYDEMLSVIKKALTDKDRLAEIGENARQRCIRDHGMRKRVDDLIKYLGETNEKH